MKKKIKLIIGIAALLVLGIAYYSYTDDISDHGRLYSSKSSLCMEFAQSYLRTIPKVERDFTQKKWEMAIDVETELYDMCLLDLNKEALSSFRAKALEKYSE